MRYETGYGKFLITKENATAPYKISLRDSGKQLPGGFRDFGSARRECDYLRGRS